MSATLSNVCSIYAGSGPVWPTSRFPTEAFPYLTGQQLLAAKAAWNFFEEVESADAATRIALTSQGGWEPPNTFGGRMPTEGTPWYRFQTGQERDLYLRGQKLHQQACPGRVWTSQRWLPVPVVGNNVYPAAATG